MLAIQLPSQDQPGRWLPDKHLTPERLSAGVVALEPATADMGLYHDVCVHLGADGVTARLDTYGVVYQIGDKQAGQSDLTLGVRYLDTVVRLDDGWVIRARVARTVWMR